MERKLTLMNMTHNRLIDVKFKDLSYVVRLGYRGQKKMILKSLDGHFRSAELTAIMGPSGAGKSTLLNILSGFQDGKYTGTVEYEDYSKQSQSGCKKTKKQLCYIQQSDNLHGFLSVHEVMTITSYLKMDLNVSQKSRQLLIDEILETLKLSQVKKTRVNRLSGGQKKRLSIALELIDNPPLMFLDEPTTGLDSLSSIQCISALKTLARGGRNIVCSIHQPSAAIYEMFDYIYLLADGHCMFRSSPGDTIDYFARQGLHCPQYHNPADYMLEVVTQEYGDYNERLVVAAAGYLLDRTEKTKLTLDPITKFSEPLITTSPPSELMRFWVLLRRRAILAYRDRTTIHVQVIFHFLVAVLLGLLFEHAGDDGSKSISNIGYLMISSLYLYYTSMMPAVLKFPLEINILRKEHFNNWYQLKTYYAAMLIFMLPLKMGFAFVYVATTYFMSNQPLEFYRFFLYLLIAILNNFIAEIMGLGLGAIFNPVNGIFVGSIIACTMLCLSGFLILFKHMPTYMYYISYLNVLRYIFDGFVYSVYGNNREKLDCSQKYCHYRIPSLLLSELSLLRPMFWIDIAVLLGHFVLYLITAYVLLKRRLSTLR